MSVQNFKNVIKSITTNIYLTMSGCSSKYISRKGRLSTEQASSKVTSCSLPSGNVIVG